MKRFFILLGMMVLSSLCLTSEIKAQLGSTTPADGTTNNVAICPSATGSITLQVTINTVSGNSSATWSDVDGANGSGTLLVTPNVGAGASGVEQGDLSGLNAFGATSITITPGISPTPAVYTFICAVTNDTPASPSSMVTFEVTVQNGPTGVTIANITNSSDLICGSTPTTLSSTLAGTTPFLPSPTYVWQRGGALPSETNSTISTTTIGMYSLEVNHVCLASPLTSSNSITLTAGTAPTVDQQPQDMTVGSTSNTFSIGLTVSGTPTVTWAYDGGDLTSVVGAGSFSGTLPGNAGDFTITNATGAGVDEWTSQIALSNMDGTTHEKLVSARIVNDCGTATTGTARILPVELGHFTGKFKNDDVVLEWTTISEMNNDFFTVEKSFDGKNFEAIGKVTGAGISTQEVLYQFFDAKVAATAKSSTIYYRLTQTDYDGQSSELEVLTVSLKKGETPYITNINLAGEEVAVYYHTPIAQRVSARVFNLQGLEISTGVYDMTEGYNELRFATPNLGRGIYIVHIFDGEHMISQKFMK